MSAALVDGCAVVVAGRGGGVPADTNHQIGVGLYGVGGDLRLSLTPT